MERYSGTSWSVGTESSSSVWQCSTLIQPPGGTVQSEHSSRAGAMVACPPPLYQRESRYANNSLCLLFFFFWNDACVLKLCPRSLICVARSQFYVQRFQIPEGHLQRQVQPPCDHPLSGVAQGSKGHLYMGEKKVE